MYHRARTVVVARLLAIRLAIYWTELHRTGPHPTDDDVDVTCDNVTAPHQTDVCLATTTLMTAVGLWVNVEPGTTAPEVARRF